MTILLDCGAIKSGGGAQLALNFIDAIEKSQWREQQISLVIPDVGPLAKREYVRQCWGRILVSPQSYLRRIVFEYLEVQRFIREQSIDTIFTFFGSGLPHPRDTRSIVTVAYPIICYPDSPYWEHLPWRKHPRIRVLNHLRKKRLRRATKIIAETEVMKRRLASVLRIPQEQIRVIPPAPSDYVENIPERLRQRGNTFLFLSGNDEHKNLWRLLPIAKRLVEKGLRDFSFVLTVDRASYIKTVKALRSTERDLMDEKFEFVGAVPPQRIMEVYRLADCVVSLSDLESFSNNYMEAWKAGIPLIASDRDFAVGGDVIPPDSGVLMRAG